MKKEMIEFKKNDFDEMIFKDKKKAVELLKNHKAVKIFYSPQRFFKYRIFNEQNDDLFLKKECTELPDDETKPIILSDIDFSGKEVLRENFRFWYFLGNEISFYKTKFSGRQTNFSASIFATERTDFFAADFRSDRTDFSAVEFKNKETSFSESRFFGRQTYFLGATFFGEQADFSRVEFHAKQTDFSKAGFECTRLSFYNSDFIEFVNLDVNKFAEKNIFTNSSFRMGSNLDITKLCISGNKLTRPAKLELGDNARTKDNLHTVKKLLNDVEQYEQADHILYWLKIYERKSNTKVIRKLLLPFEWLFLDKMTGYFTRPEKVLFSIFSVFMFFITIYTTAVIIDNKTFGTIMNNSVSLSNVLNEDASDVPNKFKSVFGNIVYFNFVTYATIGYGDILPTGLLKIISGIEGFIGGLLNALFLIVLTRKILR